MNKKIILICLLILDVVLYSCETNENSNMNKVNFITEENNEGLNDTIKKIDLDFFIGQWGKIHIWGNDTFKYVDCSNYSTITIVRNDSVNLFITNMYDAIIVNEVSDSAIIVEANQSSSGLYTFKLFDSKKADTVIWDFELTDIKNKIGTFTNKNSIQGCFRYMMFDFDKKNYEDMNGPCD